MDSVVENCAVDITLTGNVDITGYLGIFIKYLKPNTAEGEWVAALVNLATCVITYAVPNDFLTPIGVWRVKIRYQAIDGRWYESVNAYEFEVLSDW